MKTTIFTAGALSMLGALSHAQQQTLDLGNALGSPDFGYIEIPHAPELEPETITIEAWITPLGIGQGPTGTIGTMVVGKVKQAVNPLGGSAIASWWLGWRPLDGYATAGFSEELASEGLGGHNTFISSNRSIGIGERHHVAFRYDGHTVSMFVDGQKTSEFLTSIPYKPIEGYEQNSVLIGAANSCCLLHQRFDGYVDEIRIWDHPRSDFEIARDRHCRLSGTEPGLVGYWNFDGANLDDRSGNGNHGAGVGPAWDFRDDVFFPDCDGQKPRRRLDTPILLPGLFTRFSYRPDAWTRRRYSDRWSFVSRPSPR